MGWIQFSSEEELQNVLQQENHILDGVKVNIFLYSMSFLNISLVGQKYGIQGLWEICN